MYERQEVDVRELRLEELDGQELIELPERELMTGCSTSLIGIGVNASVCLSVSASVNLGSGGCK